MNRNRLITPAVAGILVLASSLLISAMPKGGRMFVSEGGSMIVFPGDSVDISAMTFIVDGDTVDRNSFTAIDPENIHSLTVTKSPANCIEVVTVKANETPLPGDTISDIVTTMVDGVAVDPEVLRTLPSDSVRKVTLVKGPRPVVMVSTRHDTTSTQP